MPAEDPRDLVGHQVHDLDAQHGAIDEEVPALVEDGVLPVQRVRSLLGSVPKNAGNGSEDGTGQGGPTREVARVSKQRTATQISKDSTAAVSINQSMVGVLVTLHPHNADS